MSLNLFALPFRALEITPASSLIRLVVVIVVAAVVVAVAVLVVVSGKVFESLHALHSVAVFASSSPVTASRTSTLSPKDL